MATRSTEAVRNGTDADGREPGPATTALGERYVPGTGSPMRWFFSGIWLVYLISPVSALFGHHHGVAWIAGGLAITVAFCVIYMLVLMRSDTQPRLARAGLAAIALLAALACAVYGKDWVPLWIYVSAATGMVLAAEPDGRRVATLGVGVVGACYLFFCWVSHLDLTNTLVVLLPVLLIGLAMMGFRMQMTLMRELAQARETVAKLATNEERLRLARDMHDLTGQSLSMITLKSELAARLLGRLPASAERDRVRDEIDQVAAVSRQTLRDIREAISGYRRPTLAVEIITARTALASAGIAARDDAELTMLSGTFDPDAEAALAWCLREAVTNVVRHSGASNCYISLTRRAGAMSLTVRDDGNGHTPSGSCGTQPSAAGSMPPSSGLRGMSERLSAVGGTLEVRPDLHPGFSLTAAVPAAPPAQVPSSPSTPAVQLPTAGAAAREKILDR